MKKSGNLLEGLKTKSPEGAIGRKAESEAASMNSDSTRSSVAHGHSIGGRTA